MRLRLFRSCSARAGAPGATTLVGVYNRPFTDSHTSPKRPRVDVSATVIACGISISMPSTASRSAALTNGMTTVRAAIAGPAPHTSILVTWLICVERAGSVLPLLNSSIVPVTCTYWPDVTLVAKSGA